MRTHLFAGLPPGPVDGVEGEGVPLLLRELRQRHLVQESGGHCGPAHLETQQPLSARRSQRR